jgi:predicted Zn-dependent protease
MLKKTIVITTFLLVAMACGTVPITGRKQMTIFPNSTMQSQSFAAYQDFLGKNQLSKNQQHIDLVRKVGKRIQASVEQYMAEKNLSSKLSGFQWEFNVVESKDVNAWCMPGGKVVVYTGIIPVCKDEAGLAVVMGHEIAHAIAEHGNERASQEALAQVAMVAGSVAVQQKPTLTNQLILQAAGAATQLGLLKYSRTHETEADHIGLIFAALAGYNPAEAPKFWERMAAATGGSKTPEYLSTHPSHETRIADLKKWQPEALQYYNRAKIAN